MSIDVNVAFSDAASQGDIERLKYLYAKHDIDINSIDTGPSLFKAAYHGHLACVEFLLENGANINVRNGIGATPIAGAANAGHLEIVKLLYTEGADIKLTAHDKNALQWAASGGHSAVIKFLENPTPSVKVENPDEVINTYIVAGKCLQEIFNFQMMERVTFVRKDKSANVEAVTRSTFEEIRNHPSLKKAFDEHVRRGGKVTESEVFGISSLSPVKRKTLG